MSKHSEDPPFGGKTLQDLLTGHTERMRALNMSLHTIQTAAYNIRSFLRWLSVHHQAHTADRLRRSVLEAWLKHLAGWRTTKGRPLKPRSINKKIENLRGFLQYLIRHGYAQSVLLDCLDYVKEPRLLPTSVLTHAQVKKLLKAIGTGTPEAYRDRAMFELLYSTGIRVGELMGLNVEDVDFHNVTMIVTGKGEKQRVVPIGRTARRYLESYIKAVRPFLQRCDEDALFLDHNGRRLKRHVIARRLVRYAARARIDVRVTPHTFRRSCTTELLRSGANMYHVKELLGHESLDTLRHYAKLTITDLKATHAKCHPRERDNRS